MGTDAVTNGQRGRVGSLTVAVATAVTEVPRRRPVGVLVGDSEIGGHDGAAATTKPQREGVFSAGVGGRGRR